MSNFELLADFLSGLKGAPASVLWALSLAGRPLSAGELLALTGYSAKPVRRAVRELLAQGIVVREGPRVLALSDEWLRMAAGSTANQARPAVTAETAADPDGSARLETAAGRPGPTPAADRSAEPAAKTAKTTADLSGPTSRGRNSCDRGQKDHIKGILGRIEHDVVVAENDPDEGHDQQQQQGRETKIPAGAERLAAALRRMGVHGRLYWELLKREDLAARPEAAVAWWWYYRTQDGVRNPTGATITRLLSRDEPPEGFLALAQLWPNLDEETRQELDSLVMYNWTAEQIAARLRPLCPGMTAGAVMAFMALSLEELEG